jgi:hypothetical protein
MYLVQFGLSMDKYMYYAYEIMYVCVSVGIAQSV